MNVLSLVISDGFARVRRVVLLPLEEGRIRVGLKFLGRCVFSSDIGPGRHSWSSEVWWRG
jgi:hypothetical protein